MRARVLATALAAASLAGCGADEPAPREREPATTTTAADPRQVPARGYTCGELRSTEYRDRQADALLDEWGVDAGDRDRLKQRLMRALFRACDPGPDYRRAAHAVARRVLGPKPSP
jgi:hypothetical protein